jgi:hypothetical protein
MRVKAYKGGGPGKAKDQEGGEVFEVKILSTGKTAWVESGFIK